MILIVKFCKTLIRNVKFEKLIISKCQQIEVKISLSFAVNLSAVTYGIICGWPSPIVPLLMNVEKNPVINEQMSDEGASWIGSLLCLGGLSIAPFSSSLAERFGRKAYGYLTAGPMFLSWLLILFATDHNCLYVARFIAGVAGSMSIFIVSTYVSEIASENIRGLLGSLLVFAINIGILLAFVAGTYMSYVLFHVFCMVFPVLFAVSFFFLPETPVYLLKRNRISEATRSLLYYRGNNKALVSEELSRLQTQVKSSVDQPNSISLCDLVRDPATLKGLIISFGLLGGQQLSGIFAMVSYAETIFKMAGASLQPEVSAIIIGVIQVFSSYLSTVLMERAGRRPLILVSCAGMCICHFILGSFCYVQSSGHDLSSISFLPIIALSAYMVSYCLGMGPAPFVVASEVFRTEVSSFANTVCFVFLWGMAFTVIKLFGPLMSLVGIEGCFMILGCMCAGCFVFSYYLVPETKGRKREDIVNELNNNQVNFNTKEHMIDNSKDLIMSERV
ncbi:unnamed protein product [Trichogramma brassicae]|uniref:Major facilitator superfamily (MFS) profile domain-containing protein n=1 Tax=Trichogramma brassicae TaxID=86971 RepID=A0A6H5IPZ9_9HYME|nr:unnamed protein product [Trichogramma brassicae]